MCAPWCRDGSGHAGEYPEDQYCAAPPFLELDLQREPAVEILAGSGRYYRPAVTATLEKEPFSDPFVAVSYSGEGHKAWSIEETRQIRDHLSELLAIVDCA